MQAARARKAGLQNQPIGNLGLQSETVFLSQGRAEVRIEDRDGVLSRWRIRHERWKARHAQVKGNLVRCGRVRPCNELPDLCKRRSGQQLNKRLAGVS